MPPRRASRMGADWRWLCLLTAMGCSSTIAEQTKEETEDDGELIGPGGHDTEDTGPFEPLGTCGIEVALDTPWYTEGETVRFTVACTQRDISEGGVSVAGAGENAVFDAVSGEFTWETDGGDGGRYDLTVGAGGDGSALESTVVTLWIADSEDAPNPRSPDPQTYTEEWGLPVVHIEVGRSLTEEEQAAVITIRGESVDGFAKIRGASSTSYPKVSYTLDFESDELGVAEWGERTREHMVLITPFDDNSYIRQKMSYDLWAAMAEHQGADRLTPRTFFTVVYIDGDYRGLYTGCDRIDDEFLRHMGTSGEGSLYKSVSHDANFYLYDASGRDKSWLGAGYEKKEGDPDNWDDIYALVAHTGGSDDAALWSDAGGLDLDEFVDWLIWAQFTLAEDSAGKNAYLYADTDDATLRWRYAPWDLNASLGQNWYTLRTSATGRNNYYWNNRVFRMLQEHGPARDRVVERYTDLRDDGPLQPSALQAMIDGYVAVLGPNIERDWERWGDQYYDFGRWKSSRDGAGDWTDPAGELEYVRAWLDARVAMYDADGPI